VGSIFGLRKPDLTPQKSVWVSIFVEEKKRNEEKADWVGIEDRGRGWVANLG
jgi:hypothetical protein